MKSLQSSFFSCLNLTSLQQSDLTILILHPHIDAINRIMIPSPSTLSFDMCFTHPYTEKGPTLSSFTSSSTKPYSSFIPPPPQPPYLQTLFSKKCHSACLLRYIGIYLFLCTSVLNLICAKITKNRQLPSPGIWKYDYCTITIRKLCDVFIRCYHNSNSYPYDAYTIHVLC